MKVKAHHPIVEAMAKKLLGIEMCPPEEQKRMVARAVSVVAEMVAELEADAKLGRMVRGLAPGGKLKRLIPGGWHCMNRFGQQDAGLTPEEALEKAGVKG